MTSKSRNARITEAIVAELEKSNLTDDALDTAVCDAYAEAAEATNNNGRLEQVLYLVGEGWRSDDIVFAAKRTTPESQVVDFVKECAR